MAKGDAGGLPGGGGPNSSMGQAGSVFGAMGDGWDNSQYGSPQAVGQMGQQAPQQDNMQSILDLIKSVWPPRNRPEDQIRPIPPVGAGSISGYE